MNVIDHKDLLTVDAEPVKGYLEGGAPAQKVDKLFVERNLFADESLDGRTFAVSHAGNFAACLTRGPLSNGHSLLFSRRDVCSLASATVRLEAYDDYRNFLGKIIEFLSNKFECPIFQFEHGMPSGSLHGGCGTSRAHSHLIPSELQAKKLLAVDTQTWIELTDLAELRRVVATGSAYLAIRDGSGQSFYRAIGRNEMLPSQYLRSLYWTCAPSARSFDWRDESVTISEIVHQASVLKADWEEGVSTRGRRAAPRPETYVARGTRQGRV
jgi:diadenosine tetraphosphate (Ap4A) HIT family hydrolase